ncbi:transcriptional regulator [Sugiyamaella lignohabitans]|uniref:Transcriptional regulator n=1 Tax=Sugiyamaella lignohabitans TaxID=796027 RepID=A0A167DVW2_9ASCO|nr:transcriptional regulator [Sugiyamaella lignohabitans]ANB13352.1 transcriptional regulator [Sugiyamaella lignohabitans]
MKAPRIRIASSAAFVELLIATVATGTPRGIWTIECSESTPSRTLPFTGTPITGSEVIAATIPGKWAAPPAPAMIAFTPLEAASTANFDMR